MTELFSSKIREKYKLPYSSTLNVAIKSLLKKDLIHKENKKYKIINPIYKVWLQQIAK
ncbi:MAG: hypothetical protein KAT68_04450 [Bacteroidales bacterium]|nr:hypothetical protein [Bacteroidales bacterium]